MDRPYESTLKGRWQRTTVAEVEEALRGMAPRQIRVHAVHTGGVRYPVKQAFAVAFGVRPAEFGAHKARKVFLDMGFTVTASLTDERRGRRSEAARAERAKARGNTATAVRPRFPRATGLPRPSRREADPDDGTPAAQ
jgi:hypothetical protein